MNYFKIIDCWNPRTGRRCKGTIRSEKVKDSDPLPATYEENTALPFGTEKVVDKGKLSAEYFKSYRVFKKGDTVVKEEPLHNSSYKGKPQVIQRNTTLKHEETVQETHVQPKAPQQLPLKNQVRTMRL